MTLIAKAAAVLGAGLGQPLAEAGRQCQCNRVSPVGVWGWLQSQCRVFPGSSGESICLPCGRPRFDPWVRKVPWRRKWQLTPVLLPGKFHGQRQVTVHGVIRSWTLLSNLTSLHFQSQCRYQDQEVQNEVTGAPQPMLCLRAIKCQEQKTERNYQKNVVLSVWPPNRFGGRVPTLWTKTDNRKSRSPL